MKSGHSGLTRLFHSFRYSCKGLKAGWVNEAAFRLEVILTVIMLPVGIWLARGLTDALLLISSVLIVLIVELLNSAVEAVVDRIGPERHPLSGRAKDMASAAVFLSTLLAGAVWGSLLLVKLGALSGL